jgi:DNA-binding transcriptional MerR regulator
MDMRIGELADAVGVSPDTIRFYEREGLLPRPPRQDNGYRDYGSAELERIRLMLDLRRLDIPLSETAEIAGWCQTGHCAEASTALPAVLSARRAAVRARIRSLEDLDRRLAAPERHLGQVNLPVLGQDGPCCSAAAAIRDQSAKLT